MADVYADRATGLSDPVNAAVAVTPHDSNLLTQVSRALYVGATGDLVVTMANGVDVTFVAVPVGIMPLRVLRVKATGTTASSIVSLS